MFEISYANLMMMLATIPNYSTDDEEDYEYEATGDDFVNFFKQNYN